MMEIEKNTTSKRTKWIHSQLSFKQINIISLSINNLTHKNTYKIKIIFKFNKLKKAIKLHAVTANQYILYSIRLLCISTEVYFRWIKLKQGIPIIDSFYFVLLFFILFLVLFLF